MVVTPSPETSRSSESGGDPAGLFQAKEGMERRSPSATAIKSRSIAIFTGGLVVGVLGALAGVGALNIADDLEALRPGHEPQLDLEHASPARQPLANSSRSEAELPISESTPSELKMEKSHHLKPTERPNSRKLRLPARVGRSVRNPQANVKTDSADDSSVISEVPVSLLPAPATDPVDDLLNRAIRAAPHVESEQGNSSEVGVGTEAGSVQARAVNDQQEVPSRGTIQRVLTELFPLMRRCAGGRAGIATARIRIQGDGHVDSVSIAGTPFGGTAQGTCMEGVIRRVRFPSFRRSVFDITFPFSIRP
ncbi:MAG: hypothetical protein AAF355_04840 [Myxococcota bacterium]